ncbi:unnamed protein product [Chrysoparadoxa australica]
MHRFALHAAALLSQASRRSASSKAGKPTMLLAVGAATVAVGGTTIAQADSPSEIDITDIIDADSERRGNGQSIGPTFVRLAWHSSGTYCKHTRTGGSCGATMRFSPEKDWGANAGLQTARDMLEPVKKKYPNMSTADLWTLAGATAVEAMGGPEIKWRPGRTDSEKPTTVPDGRLPNADMGGVGATVQHVRDIFGRMGFNDQEMVALIGAHALGRCHTNASGYWGPWTRAETTFSNEYFRLLLEETWTLKKKHEGKPWTGPDQFEDPSGELMMLPADIALIWDKDFRAICEKYAKDEDLFFKDFAAAFTKLTELGVKFPAEASSGIIAKIRGLLGL